MYGDLYVANIWFQYKSRKTVWGEKMTRNMFDILVKVGQHNEGYISSRKIGREQRIYGRSEKWEDDTWQVIKPKMG